MIITLSLSKGWIPAFAGMTESVNLFLRHGTIPMIFSVSLLISMFLRSPKFFCVLCEILYSFPSTIITNLFPYSTGEVICFNPGNFEKKRNPKNDASAPKSIVSSNEIITKAGIEIIGFPPVIIGQERTV